MTHDEVGQAVDVGAGLRPDVLGPRERVDGALGPPDDAGGEVESWRRARVLPGHDEVLRLLERGR